jgi:hypothetical protein
MRTILIAALLLISLSGCKSTRPRQEPPRQESPPTGIVPARADLKT